MNTSGSCGRIRAGARRRRCIGVTVVLAALVPLVADRAGATAPIDGEYVGTFDTSMRQRTVAAFTPDGAAPVPAAPPTTIPTATTTTVPGAVAIPPATQQPTGLGTDPALDALAQACFNGDMAACDDLYLQGASGSPYEQYGDTCAGRQPLGTGLLCANVFSAAGPAVPIPPATQQPTGLGADPALDALAQACFNGDMAACDDLYRQAASGSPYEQYGDTCAGRQPLGTGLLCANVFSAAAPTTPPPPTAAGSTATTAVNTAPPASAPATTVGGVAVAGDPTSEAVAMASMLQAMDVSPVAESSGIDPDDDVNLPGWTENGGVRALGQTLTDDVFTVFDFRWQFPDAAAAAAFLDAAEAQLSEVEIGSVSAPAPVTPVGDTRYDTFSSNLFTPVVGFNYLMRHENIVAKVYVSGSEGDVTEQEAARIAQAAGARMIAAHSASTTPQSTVPTTTLLAQVPTTLAAQAPTTLAAQAPTTLAAQAPTSTASAVAATITLSGLDQSGNPISDTYTCTELHDFVMNPDRPCDDLRQGLWDQLVAANPQAFQDLADLETLGNFSTLPIMFQQDRAFFGFEACVFRSAADYASYDEDVRGLLPELTPADTQRMWDEAHRVLCPNVP